MRALGERLRLPHSWVGKIETGERRLDVAEYIRLCRALEADPHEGLDVMTRVVSYPTLESRPAPIDCVAETRRRGR